MSEIIAYPGVHAMFIEANADQQPPAGTLLTAFPQQLSVSAIADFLHTTSPVSDVEQIDLGSDTPANLQAAQITFNPAGTGSKTIIHALERHFSPLARAWRAERTKEVQLRLGDHALFVLTEDQTDDLSQFLSGRAAHTPGVMVDPVPAMITQLHFAVPCEGVSDAARWWPRAYRNITAKAMQKTFQYDPFVFFDDY